jgi:hypothetical protein
MPQSTVRIDSNLVDELRTYQKLTGIPISKSIEEAVDHHLNIIHSRLQIALAEIKAKGPDARLNKAEKELMSRVTSDGAIHLHDKERIAVAPPPPLSKEAKAEIEAAFKESGKPAKGGKK